MNQAATALLLIDLQPDFMPGGALAVAGGDAILPGINALAQRFEHVVLTQDWHPPQHISFASTHEGQQEFSQINVAYGPQMLWPEHCLQYTAGAALHPLLDVPHAELILRKGFRRQIDSYSAFLENDHLTPTGLAGYLRDRGITTLYLAGLAYDYCVRYSALDGQKLGFDTRVITDLTRAVNADTGVAETDNALDAAAIPRVLSETLL